MKNLVLILGIAVLGFTNQSSAANGEKAIKLPQGKEETVMTPTSITKADAKSIDEVIAENNQITESSEAVDSTKQCDQAIELIIAEDNLIIESDFQDVVYPLDFEKINRKLFVKMNNKQRMIGEL